MKNLIIATLFLGLSILSFGQKKIDYIPLSSFSPTANDDDLKQLDTFFKDKQIIGIGESTHGTSEFTAMRHRLFKYLVEHHQFNTFFLEADYNACKRVNRYIHGADDHVDSALMNVLLWPWITREMTVLIDWMRLYNAENDNKLSFIGCDMQLLEDERKELDLFFKGNEEVIGKLDRMFTFVNNGRSSDSVSLLNAFSEWNIILDLTRDERSNDWKLIKKGVSQWFEACFEKSFDLRDSCMAENMMCYSSLNLGTKGMYFAHNSHSGKYTFRSANKYREEKAAGQYLFEQMGNNYSSIALLTYDAVFTVGDACKNEIIEAKRILKTRKSFENSLHQLNEPVLFTTAHLDCNSNYLIGNIGAVIGKHKGVKIQELIRLKPMHFDAILFIDKTTPTQLVK